MILKQKLLPFPLLRIDPLVIYFLFFVYLDKDGISLLINAKQHRQRHLNRQRNVVLPTLLEVINESKVMGRIDNYCRLFQLILQIVEVNMQLLNRWISKMCRELSEMCCRTRHPCNGIITSVINTKLEKISTKGANNSKHKLDLKTLEN